MLANPQPGLTFGALNLIGASTDIANYGYSFEALGDDTDWGNPVPVDDKVISWLQDGAIIARKNYDNREILVRVRIRATTSAGLAAGESALMLETGKPNLLTWTPPDAASPPCVFSVVMSNLELVFDDLNEDRRIRVYGLRIQAEPFVRSSTLATVTKPGPTGTQTITSIDACTSATNWNQTIQVGTGSPVTTAAAVDGGTAITAQTTSFLSTTQSTRVTLTRSSLSAAMSTTPYLRVDLTPSPIFSAATWANGTVDLSFKLNGLAAPVASQTGPIYWFDASALSITTLTTFEATGYVIGTGAGGSFKFDVADLSRSNVLGDQGTGRQLTRSLPVVGSARTQGNLAIADAANALGTTLVYTYPQAAGVATPSLRQYYTTGAGAITADATTVYATTMDISTPSVGVFEIPAVSIQPGGYLLVARLKHASAGARTASWQINGKQGSTILTAGAVSGTVPFTSTAGGWVMVTLATVSLPTVKVGPSGKVYVQIATSTGVLLDEAWLFNMDTGNLTWVECGTAAPSAGGSANRLWLDAPNVSSPAPAAYVGFASDRSDAYHAGGLAAASNCAPLNSFAVHEFVPPAMNVFTVTTNSTASSVTLTHYPRYQTHAVT